MSAEHGAGEHLRAIRQLMERATVYRTISAPTALVGGVLAVGMAAGMIGWKAAHPLVDMASDHFFELWLLVLGLTAAANTGFVLREAWQRGAHPVSAGMKHALRSIAPSFLTGGILSASMALTAPTMHLPVLLWLVFYGLGLLATMSFAPRSIIVLGSAFLATGVSLFALVPRLLLLRWDPAAIMGVTFGGYHLCYAAIVWALDRRKALDAVEDRPLVTAGYPPLP